MALTAAVTHASRALPRRRHRRGPAPSTHLAPPLSTPPPPPRPSTLDRVLSGLEAQPRLLTPSLLAPLLAALPLHPAPRRRLAALRGLLPVSLLRRHPDLALRLLHIHASLGLLAYAHHIFDHLLPARTRRERAFPWNCLVAGYASVGRHDDALALYLQMDEEGAPRDGFTFESALRACSGARSAELGRAVHRDALTAGLAADVSVCDALVEMYAQCGDMEMACQVFDAMPERDAVSWNVLLGGLLGHGGLSAQATEAWRRMLGEGHKPDSVVLSAMLWHHPGDGKQGREVHAWVIRHWLETELSVANALIGMYSRKNELGHALSVFESMPVRELASWNAIISAHSQDFRVLMLFRRMVDSGARPDEATFMAVLSACDNLGLVEGGMRLFSEMENKYRIQPTVQHCTSLVNMLGKAGMVNEAYEFMSKRRRLSNEPTVLRSLLHASSVHGNIRIGEISAEKLFDLEPENVHNFFTLMKMYENTDRLEDLEKVKKMMRDKGL
ncbi:pentatricopeptide repeat-containing protein At4g25270, chloroplastic-like [Hordeum vulgare subsp. vulgare]|uniref:Pentatricopeptide repeat-containing protein n=1 Tax=Hordeum vulgare subsp. vulgare TaxID=112509 RepID=A0A8I6YMZ5_HORVV|nr:pentatricopeptide repeat-containing protein At4g25270, chloroplastic-like [Hordeum vulgare subsp. vulgare]